MFAIALCSTVLLMVTTAYFILGSIPLLVLKHDTPLDARFVRGFFNIYYVAAFATATAAAISLALAGFLALGGGAAVLALIAVGLRKKIIPKMGLLGAQIQAGSLESVPGFRRVHIFAIVINIAQLVIIVSCLINVSRSQMLPATAPSAAPAVATFSAKQR